MAKPNINIGAIELTPDEAEIRAAMKLNQEELFHDTDAAQKNGELANRLMNLLLERHAIPEQRLKYFDDPVYKRGVPRGSRKQMFELNKTFGEDIYSHLNFLKHLRYFLLGANLPRTAIDEFSEKAFACGHVGPSDALMLGKLARDLTRKYGLASHEVADEFYKLALDCQIYHGHADTIQEIVKKTR